MRFDGRSVVVTGGAGGLGRAYAEYIGGLGGRVCVNDIHGAEDAAAELRAGGVDAVADGSDISTRDGARALADRAAEAFGQIDVLINNAGVGRFAPMAELDLDDYELVRRVALDGAVYLTHAVWPHMIRNTYGRVVMTTSGNGMVGDIGSSAYAASKAGVYGLMRVLALEGREHGIKVNAVAPVAYTPMSAAYADDEVGAEMRRAYPTDLVAPAVALLAHEQCPSSGTVLDVGGGRVGTAYVESAPGYYARDFGADTLLNEWGRVVDRHGAEVLATAGATTGLVQRMAAEAGGR